MEVEKINIFLETISKDMDKIACSHEKAISAYKKNGWIEGRMDG